MLKLPSFQKKQPGFTLIELLIVVAIIVILIALAAVSYTTVQRNARNDQRKADLNKIAIALEEFYADHGFYPSTENGLGDATWESAGRSAGDHIRCLLGPTYNNTSFPKGTKKNYCSYITSSGTLTNLPANVYIANADPNKLPKDPAYTDAFAAAYAYVSDGRTFALATRHYEGSSPSEHRFTGGEYWSPPHLSPWEAELKDGNQYIVRSPNHN